MGFCHESHGPNRISVEERRESFKIHPGYGYDEAGNEHSDHHGDFGVYWREHPHPEFLLEDLDHLIAALNDLRPAASVPVAPEAPADSEVEKLRAALAEAERERDQWCAMHQELARQDFIGAVAPADKLRELERELDRLANDVDDWQLRAEFKGVARRMRDALRAATPAPEGTEA